MSNDPRSKLRGILGGPAPVGNCPRASASVGSRRCPSGGGRLVMSTLIDNVEISEPVAGTATATSEGGLRLGDVWWPGYATRACVVRATPMRLSLQKLRDHRADLFDLLRGNLRINRQADHFTR